MSIVSATNDITQIQNHTNATYAAKSKVGDSDIGQDAFLRLMIEQMKNQDPSNPKDNSQMMLQTASFTQVSELQKLNSNMTSMNGMSQACSLMGKYVELTDPEDSTKTTKGVVSEVRNNGKESTIVLAGQSNVIYPLSTVKTVREPVEGDPTTKPEVVIDKTATNASKYRGLVPPGATTATTTATTAGTTATGS